MRDQHARHVRIGPRKGFADKLHLLLAHPSVLEGQRPGGVDAENRHARQLDERAERLVDIAAIARERRQEASKHIVQRHVMISGDAEHFMARIAQPVEELAGLLELLGSGALREVAADDDEVGLYLLNLRSTAETSRSS